MRSLIAAAMFAAALVACGACGSPGGGPGAAAPLPVPVRALTAGDGLLALAPAGADLVVELDLARLRDNPAVGPLLAALIARPPTGSLSGLDFGLLGAADVVLVCSYGLDGEPESLTLVRGPGAAALPGAAPLDERTAALGPPALIARLDAVRDAGAPSLAADRELLRLRAAAMPPRAEGGALRVAARLGFEARVRLAALLELDHVATTVSIWGDVADDLAIVALLGGADAAESRALAEAGAGLRDRLAGDRWVRGLGLGAVVGGVVIEPRAEAARVVLVVGPRRLEQLVRRSLSMVRAEESGS